ncbi:gluconokinase [Microbacterium laevaniformans]|uniref:gluconokinase n=1 Tax=Microbacterium laevaniformans TaxID=36807 RepID=UPI00362DB345
MTGVPAVVVIMGPSGVGKTTLGATLADCLGRPFIDADDLHPASNVAKMAAGVALTDEDRWPWLDAIAARAAERAPVVVACSSLRRAYRDRLRDIHVEVAFVEPFLPREVHEARVRDRRHAFMPPGLLGSQLLTLESLADDERGVRVLYTGTAQQAADTVIAALSGRVTTVPREAQPPG